VKDYLLSFLKWSFILGFTALVLGGSAVAGIFYFYGHDLPDIMTRSDYDPMEVTRVFSDDGKLIAEFHKSGGKRTVVPLESLPDHVKYAFMAAEDADFMNHEGIDYWGMLRAFYYAIVHGKRIKGTSTITQQVVKNLILVPERTIERKVKEIILARELENNLSKQDILYLYLNTVYLGEGNYGVEEAARFFFGVSADKLSVDQAAVLAGMLPGPAKYNPLDNPEAAKQRRSYVLRQLWEKGFIEEARYRTAVDKPIKTVPYSKTFPHLGTGKYFVEHVRQTLVDRYGPETVWTGGLRVHTTLNVDKQRQATRASRQGVHTYDDRRHYYEPIRQIEPDTIDGFADRHQKQIAKQGLQPGSVYEAVVTDVVSPLADSSNNDEAADQTDTPGSSDNDTSSSDHDAASTDDPPASIDQRRVQLKLGTHTAELTLEPIGRILRDNPSLADVLQRGDVLEVVPLQTTPNDDGAIPVRFHHGPQPALVSINHDTRDLEALVGGYDFDFNKYNHATQMRRQTGSTFKPFVYGAGLEDNVITPATVYLDSPAVFQMHDGSTWSPKNSDEEWRGPVRVREGLGASRNVVAVRVLKDVGIDRAASFARRLGVKSNMVRNYTMVMGSSELTPIELVNAYATIASGGLYAEPRLITKVKTSAGEIDTFEVDEKRVIARDVAYLLTNLMTSVVEGYVSSEGERRGGTAYKISKLKQRVAGKTGTTNKTRDAWFVGFTPQLTTGVWVGFDDNRSLGPREYGGRVAGPIWLDYMKSVLKDQKPHAFQPPDSGITTANIDPQTGKLARKGGILEHFLAGTAPTQYAPSDTESTEENFLMNQFRSEQSDGEKPSQNSENSGAQQDDTTGQQSDDNPAQPQ
jgi:penicillin-binding protein 1A